MPLAAPRLSILALLLPLVPLVSGCGSGSSGTSSGTSSGGTTSGATTPNWPLVPNNDGGILATPNLVLLTYASDPNQSMLELYGVWIADGGYLPTVVGEYGIGNGTLQLVSLTDSPPTSDGGFNPFPDYLATHFDSAAMTPPYAPNNLYVIVLPAPSPNLQALCGGCDHFHAYFHDSLGAPRAYAVVFGSTAPAVEQYLSDEIVDGTTDPFLSGWRIQDPDNPWSYSGGELADLCLANTDYSTYYSSGSFIGSPVWSNLAVQAGGVPCEPWPTTTPYLSVIAPTTMATAAAGGQAEVVLTGWASGDAMLVLSTLEGAGGEFVTTPHLSGNSLTPGETVTLTLSVPANATPGSHGAVLVYVGLGAGASSHDVSLVPVGVTAQ